MNNYWQLIKWDKEVIKVRPENVQFVQEKLDSGEGFIKTPTRSIAVKDIKDFVESDERYIDQKLLEDGLTTFGEAIIDPNGSVITRYVKKSVTKREFNKYYMYNAAYRKLSESDNHVQIVWQQPLHLINLSKMSELTQDEERQLAVRV